MDQPSHAFDRRAVGEDLLEVVQRLVKTVGGSVDLERRMDEEEEGGDDGRKELDRRFELRILS